MNGNGAARSSVLPNWSTRQVIAGTLFVVAILATLWLLVRFRVMVYVLFVAIVISTAITPGVDWLQRRGISRALGVILIYLTLVAVLAGFILLVAPLILNQTAAIAAVLPEFYEDFQRMLLDSPSYLLRRLSYELPSRFQITQPGEGEVTDEEMLEQVAEAFRYAGLVVRGFLVGVVIFLLGFYWTLEGERTTRSLLLLIPMSKRESVREIVATIQSRLGNYIRGQTILCVSIGAMALVAYLIIGVPYAFSLALFAGLMEAVPVVGPFLGAVPAGLVVLGAGEPEKILWVVVSTMIIQTLEGNLMVPRIMGKSVGISPLVTLLAIAAFSSLLGIVGALLAIPVAAVVQVLMDHFLLQASPQDQIEVTSRDSLGALRLELQELIGDVRKHVREKDGVAAEEADHVEDAIEEIANELDQVLVQHPQDELRQRRGLP